MTTIDWSAAARVPEHEGVDRARFEADFALSNRPAVFKGLVAGWPAVDKAQKSADVLAAYLKGFAGPEPVDAFVGPPAIKGRFFYGDDLKSFNFERVSQPLPALLDRLLAARKKKEPAAIYAGAVNIPKHLPDFAAQHVMPLLDPETETLASVWVGNRTRTAAHWDMPQNLAAVVAGKRRFTLFPTEQVHNLYIGPLDFTLAGQPLSLVDFHEPDLERFPRFAEAAKHALVAELEPGDVLFIPSLWAHHVESLDDVGMLVNFWWRDDQPHMISPIQTMLHALLTLRDLPQPEREGWRVLFDNYIFKTNGEPMAHIPEEVRGVFGELTPEAIARIKAHLIRTLSR